MSDTSEDSSKGGRSISEPLRNENICRDYLRGMCDRKSCKFKHEHEVRTLNFCHDFQNSSCPRPSCKFIHCTPDEVEDYKRTGEMSNQILAEATRKNQLPGLQPICNSYRKGTCRWSHCKYRHISKEEEDAEILVLIKNNNKNRTLPSNQAGIILDMQQPPVFDSNVLARRGMVQAVDELEEYGPTIPKRRFIANGIGSPEMNLPNRTFKGYFAGSPPQVLSRVDTRTIMLEEENNMLQKEIAQLKKQVSDLIATNEFLLDQNATLRVSGKRNGTVSLPPVTLASTLTQQSQVLGTVAASVATVPVSLATVTTGNAVSVGCPAVSIAPAAQILAPSQQILVTTNQPTQLALANSSQAQLAIAQQNLAQPQLALANSQQAQQLGQQLSNQAQQLALANTTQQLTSQAQQIALANSAMNTQQQLTSQGQQLTLANTPQQLAVAANVSQQLALASTSQQLLASQNLASSQQLELHVGPRAPINTSQTIAISNATPPMVSYPIMTHTLPH